MGLLFHTKGEKEPRRREMCFPIRKLFILEVITASPGETMSLLDLLRQEYLKARVVDKYRLDNGNVGLIVEDAGKRYHVEFKDGGKGPCLDNLFGLLNDPFSGKTEHVDRLINEGDTVELTVSYSKSPLRQAYYVHSVSRQAAYNKSPKTIHLPYRSASGY
jgi:hypothetical protein